MNKELFMCCDVIVVGSIGRNAETLARDYATNKVSSGISITSATLDRIISVGDAGKCKAMAVHIVTGSKVFVPALAHALQAQYVNESAKGCCLFVEKMDPDDVPQMDPERTKHCFSKSPPKRVPPPPDTDDEEEEEEDDESARPAPFEVSSEDESPPSRPPKNKKPSGSAASFN